MTTWTRVLNLAVSSLALAIIVLGPTHLRATAQEGATHTPAENTIVDVAVTGGFDTLVAAVQAAGLVETLQSEGPFTVFAPTDEAFAALPEGTLESLLKPENKDQLIAILTYHVVPGEVTSDQVVSLESAETLQGASLEISTSEDGVMINNAKVVKADVDASNGVVHVIDTVLLPPSK